MIIHSDPYGSTGRLQNQNINGSYGPCLGNRYFYIVSERYLMSLCLGANVMFIKTSAHLSGGYPVNDMVPTHRNINDVSLWLHHEISMISDISKSSIDPYMNLRDYLSTDHFDQWCERLEEWVGFEISRTTYLLYLSINEVVQSVYQFILLKPLASRPMVDYKNQTIMGHLAHG